MILCLICHRPLRGQPLPDGERPCHQPGGHHCYELGFKRVSADLGRAQAMLRRCEGALGEAAEALGDAEPEAEVAGG